MPTLRLSSASPPTSTTIHLVVDGLTYPASQYYAINLYKGVSPSGTLVGSMVSSGGGTSSPNYYTSAYGVTGLSPNTSYSFYANIKYQSASTTTTVSGTFSTTPAPTSPTKPTLTKISQSGLNVTIRATISSNTEYVDFDPRWTSAPYDRVYSYGATYVDKTYTLSSYNTDYQIDAIAYNSVGNSGWSTLYTFNSGSPPPPTKPTITKVSENGKTVTLRANISNTTEWVEWDARYSNDPYERQDTYGATYVDKAFTVPDWSTAYSWDVIARNSVGSSAWSDLFTWTSPAPQVPPEAVTTTLSGATGTSFLVNFSGGMGSTSVSIEVREGSTTGTLVHSNYNLPTGTSNYSVSGLKEFTTYYVKGWGVNAYGNSTWSWSSIKTLDSTKPVVTITASDGVGRMWFDFNGNDVAPTSGAMSGLSHYLVWISTPNGGQASLTNYFVVNDLNLSYYTFTTDRDGGNFQHGAVYTLAVRSVDVSGNWSDIKTVAVTFTRVRPNNWNNWTGSGQKVSGSNFNVTATEWESLGKAINQFRTYKGLITRDFTVPIAGQTFTAGIFNQYVNALNDMSPPTSPPSTKAKGDIMYASDFNKLANSLNSIP